MSEEMTVQGGSDTRLLKILTYSMFFLFAMTSDAVGSLLPTLIVEFHLSMKSAAALHYAPMASIGAGALLAGSLAHRIGRKVALLAGLSIYGASSLLFAFGHSFSHFVALSACAGIGISIFKVGAFTLLGDIARSAREHTSLMNKVEGFFALGAIVGPALVATLLSIHQSWKYLYVIAAAVCALLIAVALLVAYPATAPPSGAIDPLRMMRVLRSPYALGMSLLVMLYVTTETAIYVWMPTYLQGYTGMHPWLAGYALSTFFGLRAAGRFLGPWLLARFAWSAVLAALGGAVLCCFAASLYGGPTWGLYALPLSGLFMSLIYPTLNSKAISCFRSAEHAAVAALVLFFTACAAGGGPVAMAAVSDACGGPRYGFVLATGFALVLFVGLLVNGIANPTQRHLRDMERSQYGGGAID